MKKIIIIGGGIAGLSAGCYGRMNGFDTHLFEMHDLPGGLCTSWTRKGYTFDGSIHWLGGTSPEEPAHQVWRELGALKGKKIFHKDISLKIHLPNGPVDFHNDPDRLADNLNRIAPEDRAAIRELVRSLEAFYPLSRLPLTKPKELFSPLDTIRDLAHYLPLIRLFQSLGNTTAEQYARRFKSPVLREAIRSTIENTADDKGGNNGFAGVLFLLATKGMGFPEGGSLRLAESIAERYRNLGGSLHYNKKIRTILVENGAATGVRLEDGTEERADIVVSAADGYDTLFRMLGGRHLNRKLRHCYAKEPVTPSFVQVSIGVDMDVSRLADPHAIFNIYPLAQPMRIGGKDNTLIRVKNYSFDPSFAPPGKSTLVIPFASESSYWEPFCRDPKRYKAEKKQIEETVLAWLETACPGIRSKIEVVDVATPMTYMRYTNNWKGSSMGFAKAFMLDLPRTLPGLKHFYMAGQWAGDMGVSGAAKSGRDIVELICARNGAPFVTTTI